MGAQADCHVKRDLAPAVVAASATPIQCSAATACRQAEPIAAGGDCSRLCPLHTPATSSNVVASADAGPLPVAAVAIAADTALMSPSSKSQSEVCLDEHGLSAQHNRATAPVACTKEKQR